jgi:serine/threonine protein kinase/predicted esterase
MALSPGRHLGPYEIVAPIGAGGMGEVYRASDARLGRDVAVKVLPEYVAKNPEALARFEREARTAAGLSDPHVCALYDVGTDGDVHYAVFELLEGETLRERLSRGPLPPMETIELATQMCQGLTAAHVKGIVHRDLKPENLFLTRKGLKILDFGLAKLHPFGGGPGQDMSREPTLSAQEELTNPGSAPGTVAYMSPEQARGERTDARSDIFGLGVVLYEMLSGERPFRRDTHLETLAAILKEDPPELASPSGPVPPGLERVVRRCLEKKADARYSGAGELLGELEELRSRLSAPTVRLRDVARRPSVAVPALLVLLAVLMIAGWSWWHASRVRWARQTALPEVERLVNEDDFVSAFRLARQIETLMPDDPTFRSVMQVVSCRFAVETSPAGAEVYFKDYRAPGDEWTFLGRSPIESTPLPVAYLRFRFVKEGFAPVERAAATVYGSLRITLDPMDESPPGMIRVPAGSYKLGARDPVALPAYWLDRYEVTNEQFKRFVDAGGYRQPKHWKEPFFAAGKPISWETALSRFRDRTGQPGPAAWEAGAYPEEREDDPVRGVSWYEAVAYADFVGKTLPTVYHWFRAARAGSLSDIVPLSNFGGEGPLPVGRSQGLSPFGAYDMAGNVKEWCWNAADGRRYILGGSWNEPPYMFQIPEPRDPMDRSVTNGFRCALSDEPLPDAATGSVPLSERLFHDHRKDEPVGDDVFQFYKTLYAYDRTDLNAMLEEVDESASHWRKEKITLDAAYGSDRLTLYLFLPRETVPPYQAVAYLPGADGFSLKSLDDMPMRFLDFIIRSGRALAYPIYDGMYGRGPRAWTNTPNAFREQVIHQYQDLERSIDYLESRDDMDRESLAYYGFSWGACLGPIVTALDERFKASVLVSGGLFDIPVPEAHALHFASRSTTPTLMVNGRHDFGFNYETSQVPMFRLLGAPEADKRHAVFESGHIPPRLGMIQEILGWLDRCLGPVRG